MLKGMADVPGGLKDDDGRAYIYDMPTLDDPTRAGTDDEQRSVRRQ